MPIAVDRPAAAPAGSGAGDADGQQRCQHPLAARRRRAAGEELLDRVDRRVDVAGPERVVAPGSSTSRAPGMWRAR